MILHVITGLSVGGAETALFRMVSMVKDKRAVHVVCLSDGGQFFDRLIASGVSVTALGLTYSPTSLIKFAKLVVLLKKLRPELVQTWMYHADLVGGVAAAVARVPVVWGIRHSDLSRSTNKASTLWVVRLCALLSRWLPSRAISCSARAVVVHRDAGYKVPFVVVPNGLDVSAWTPSLGARDEVRRQLGLPRGAFVFAHAGRSHLQKDHANLAKAFSQVAAQYPDARLLLCGQGLEAGGPYMEQLPFSPAGRAATLALGPRDDLPEVWQGADVFVLSSYGEGFPNVVAEAMASGLPCVVTDVGDSAEVVGETGWVVPRAAPDALAGAMCDAIRMPIEQRLALGVGARERIENNFTLERMAAGFEAVWRQVIAKEAA